MGTSVKRETSALQPGESGGSPYPTKSHHWSLPRATETRENKSQVEEEEERGEGEKKEGKE